MIVAWVGQRSIGKVRSFGGTYVVTPFVFFNFVPVAPAGGSELVLREASGGEPAQVVRIPLDTRSMLCGYARIHGVLGAIGLAAYGLLGEAHPASFLAGSAALLALAASTRTLTRPTRRERLEALAYAEITGFTADVAHAGHHRFYLQHVLTHYLDDRAKQMVEGGYRTGAGVGGWVELAARSRASLDRDFLVAAVTALRIDESLGPHEPRPEGLRPVADARALRSQLLDRLLSLDPSLARRAEEDRPALNPPSPALSWARENAPAFTFPARRPPRSNRNRDIRLLGGLMIGFGAMMGWVTSASSASLSSMKGDDLYHHLFFSLAGAGFVPAGLWLLALGEPKESAEKSKFVFWVALIGLPAFFWRFLR